MSGLLNCPFCGGERAVLTFVEGGGGLPAEAWVTCDRIACGARGRRFYTSQIYDTTGIKADAIAAWNTRADAAHREAHTAGLVEALEAINRLTSPGNRTFDAMMTDMGLACDIARAVLEAHAK